MRLQRNLRHLENGRLTIFDVFFLSLFLVCAFLLGRYGQIHFGIPGAVIGAIVGFYGGMLVLRILFWALQRFCRN